MVAYEVVWFRGCGETHMLEKRQIHKCKTVFSSMSFEVLRVPCPLFFQFSESQTVFKLWAKSSVTPIIQPFSRRPRHFSNDWEIPNLGKQVFITSPRRSTHMWTTGLCPLAALVDLLEAITVQSHFITCVCCRLLTKHTRVRSSTLRWSQPWGSQWKRSCLPVLPLNLPACSPLIPNMWKT